MSYSTTYVNDSTQSLLENNYEEFDRKLNTPSKSRCSLVCAFIAAFTCLLFLGLVFGGPPLLDYFIHQGLVQNRLVTGTDSKGYARWQSNAAKLGYDPEFLSVHLFNVTNPDDVIKGAKPILQEIGPFVYTHHHEFFDISFAQDKNTVDCKRFEKFLPYSGDPENVKVTVANIPYAGVRAVVDPDDEWFTALGFDLVASAANAGPFTTVTVQEYVFGYNSPMLLWLSEQIPALHQNTWFELQHNNTSFEEAREHLKNKTDTYYTGNDNLTLINQYKVWHGMSNLSIWNGTEANRVHGTDGTGFEIGPKADENYTIFVDTMYRHSPFWWNETEVVKGITMRKYWIDPRASWNHTMGGPYGTAYDLFGPQGVNNMTAPTAVQQGVPAPVFIHLPYFFQADPTYLDRVTFLPPYHEQNHSKYNTVLSFEPISGLCMQAKKRIQISVKLRSSFIAGNHFPDDILFPVGWFQLESTISDNLAEEFKGQVYLAIALRDHCPLAMGIAAAVFLLLAVALFTHHYWRAGCCSGETRKSLEETVGSVQYDKWSEV